MSSELTAEHLARLPFFPLPRVVLFPRALLPLHVFEPRYRELVRFCIDNDWPLAMARVLPAHERALAGDPPVATIAGAGRVIGHETLPDGRMNILLAGVARVRLTEIIPRRHAYREAVAVQIEDALPDPADALIQNAAALRACVASLSQRIPKAAEALGQVLQSTETPAALADVLAPMVVADVDLRQQLLETPQVGDRVQLVLDQLAEILASAGPRDEVVN